MTTTETTTKTIYTFEMRFSAWYIDFNSEKNIQNPYSVHYDENYKGSYRTLGEAVERIFKTVGQCDWKIK